MASRIGTKLYTAYIKGWRSLSFKINWFRLFFTPGVTIDRTVKVSGGCVIRVTDGGTVSISGSVFLSKGVKIVAQGGRVVINGGVFIGDGAILTAKESIVIGEKSLIAERVSIRDQNHHIYGGEGIPICESGFDVAPIVIGDDVWICAGSVITKGVEIKKGAVVGANAVVVNSVDYRNIVGGVPATVIAKR